MKIIKNHSDNNWVRAFRRYVVIDYVLNSNGWIDLENNLKKTYNRDYPAIMERIFNEFKFYNCVLRIEYAITDPLNRFLIKESKIKDWKVLRNKFLEKIKRNRKSTKKEAREIIKKQTSGRIQGILTPHIMLYYAGFGVGELVNYINSFTKDFSQKKELITKLTKFNKYRKLVIHNLLTSREDIKGKIEKGVTLGKEIINLIEKITAEKIDRFV